MASLIVGREAGSWLMPARLYILQGRVDIDRQLVAEFECAHPGWQMEEVDYRNLAAEVGCQGVNPGAGAAIVHIA